MNFSKPPITITLITLLLMMSCGSRSTDFQKSGDTSFSHKSGRQEELNYIAYYSEIYKADSLFMTKNYDESYKILDYLLKRYKPVKGWFVNVSRDYLISKSKVAKVERTDVENYLYEQAYVLEAILGDKSVAKLLEEFHIDKIEVEKIVAKNVSKINIPLRNELGNMTLKDQDIRNTKNYDSIKKIDWQHSQRLKEIIETVGFPNEKIVGGYNLQGKPHSEIFLPQIFNHMAYNGDYDYFKKKLPELIRNGTCDPFNYAMLEDRRNEINNRPIEYHVIIPITENSDKKKINANRKAIGLPSVEFEEFKKKIMSN
ncbi:hypothetical protein [Chryseobacterium sp. 3008163]|uniref:hypothetical protein n=1 Tax=Chryseobacterium sp. 3008163 TaxID=2478663 RepID=UPI000F0C14E9|nr:hypothetical protein [Chryseobacterium sp. 3008163]AYN01281.1 hypothetical protein EAG08_14035 [Chryseobacterium sp. 3008163]